MGIYKISVIKEFFFKKTRLHQGKKWNIVYKLSSTTSVSKKPVAVGGQSSDCAEPFSAALKLS